MAWAINSRGCPMKPLEKITLLCALAALAYACDSDRRLAGPGVSKPVAVAVGVPFTEGLASPEWQAIARNVVMQSALSRNSAAATRVYAYLSVAQHDAVVRAEDASGGEGSGTEPEPGNGLARGGRSRLEADRGAVAGASAVVLTSFDPADAQLFEDKVREQANAGPGQPRPDFARGEAVGRQVGAEAIARTMTDGFDLPWTGTVPIGPSAGVRVADVPRRARRGAEHLGHPHGRAGCHRLILGEGRGHKQHLWLLEHHRHRLDRGEWAARARGDPRVRTARRGHDGRSDRLLGREAHVLVHSSPPSRSGHQAHPGDRFAQSPVVPVRAQLLLRGGRGDVERVLPGEGR